MVHYKIFDTRPPCITLLKIHINIEVGALVWPWDVSFHYPYCDWSHHSNFYMKSLIFSKKFYKFHKVGILSQDLVNKNNNLRSLIFTNLRVKFESCVLNLIKKWSTKHPKYKDDHLIFMNFRAKEFTIKRLLKKKTLMFELYNLMGPLKQGAVNFLG
jgi:hypothetical protein